MIEKMTGILLLRQEAELDRLKAENAEKDKTIKDLEDAYINRGLEIDKLRMVIDAMQPDCVACETTYKVIIKSLEAELKKKDELIIDCIRHPMGFEWPQEYIDKVNAPKEADK